MAGSGWAPSLLRVICKPLDWQIDGMAQICHGLIPALSCVERLTLNHHEEISSELRDGGIDSATWHDLLRLFIEMKELDIGGNGISEELSHALQVDEVGLDQEFLPNLRSIRARRNLFRLSIHAKSWVVQSSSHTDRSQAGQGKPRHDRHSVVSSPVFDQCVRCYSNGIQLVWYTMYWVGNDGRRICFT